MRCLFADGFGNETADINIIAEATLTYSLFYYRALWTRPRYEIVHFGVVFYNLLRAIN